MHKKNPIDINNLKFFRSYEMYSYYFFIITLFIIYIGSYHHSSIIYLIELTQFSRSILGNSFILFFLFNLSVSIFFVYQALCASIDEIQLYLSAEPLMKGSFILSRKVDLRVIVILAIVFLFSWIAYLFELGKQCNFIGDCKISYDWKSLIIVLGSSVGFSYISTILIRLYFKRNYK